MLSTLRASVATRYAVHEEIGRGGAATVFRATSRLTQRVVAIKVLHPELYQLVGVDRFQREIRILSRLEHPTIVPLLDSGEGEGLLYYVMPFISGETLRSRLRLELQLPIEEAVSITRTVLTALQFAHDRNVIHRDIKPENILLEGDRVLVADFGIARAIIRASGESISSTGFAIGTPAYMSPEQAAGEARLDGRSDVYSTGCVLYEMLGGTPPFSGTSVQAIRARHMHEPPPALRVVRPTIPEALQAAVEKALAKVPADRYSSAARFSAALDQALQPGVATVRPVAGRRKRTALIVGGAVLVLASGVGLLWRRGPGLDPDRYAVLPFRFRGGDSPGLLTAGNSTRLMWQSLSRWRDLRLVDEALVEDRIRESSDPPTTLSQGMNLARSLHAGMLVWGEVAALGDSVWIRAALFRVTTRPGEPLRRAEVALPRTTGPDHTTSARSLVDAFSELARDLVAPSSAATGAPAASTTYYRALQATLSGDSALLQWNLNLARERYREAFSIDPDYAVPRFRFAQASLWSDAPVSEWRPLAETALASTSQLSPLEALEVAALVALGRGEFPRACDGYRRILAQDSLRFAGWFGLGECLTRDSVVVPDRASASGWRFRSSYAAGVTAYRRALTLVPLSHLVYSGVALDRLSRTLMVESNVLRFGVTESEPVRRFAAFPSFTAESLGFIPYPIEEVLAGARLPPSRGQAVEANRRVLLEITSEWHTRYPTSEPAIKARAFALELAGSITSPATRAPSALGLVQGLRAAVRNRPDIALAAWEVRLLIKARRFTEAREVAEQTLTLTAETREDGVVQAGLAALTGRLHRAADLLARFGAEPFATPEGIVPSPPSVAAEAYRLLVYAAFGTPADSIRNIAGRVRAEVERRVLPAKREAMLEAALFQPRLLAYPLLPPPASRGLPITRIEHAIAQGDLQAARREFAALGAQRQAQLPGDVVPDHVVLEARLLSILGDTAAARARLEPMLDDLDAIGTELLNRVSQAAAVGRGIILYRELGGDMTARGLDSALATLWRHAENPLLTLAAGRTP